MKRWGSLLGLLLIVGASAQDRPYMLTDLVRDLSQDPNAPAAVEAILGQLGNSPQATGVLTPAQKHKIGGLIKAAVKSGQAPAELDYLPPATVAQMGQALRAFSQAQAQGGAPATEPSDGGLPGGPQVAKQPRTERLGLPTDAAAPSESGLQDLGLGLQRGDEVDPDKASRYPASARLAAVLNELALNDPSAPMLTIEVGKQTATTPLELVKLIQQNHKVEVRDARYFANFADLYYRGREVATPFWINTELAVPGSDRPLLVPAGHAQHELIVRGANVNADVSFFMGIDGDAKFRPMLSKGNAWTGGRVARTYTGEQAGEAVRVAGEVRRSFEANKAKHPELPHGGYFHLGVCNDSNAFIEQALTGTTTLYPLSRDPAYYLGDGEIDRLSRAMPIDGRGVPADLARVVGSLPEDEVSALAFPSLRHDLLQFGGEDARGIEDLLPR
ncbi:MAG: hypothetical protein R3F62_02385 [Planctomycetota bacterium]